MKPQTSAGSTFRVHDVDVVRTPLSTWKTRDSIVALLAESNHDSIPEPVVACSGYNSNVVRVSGTPPYHALFFAAHVAFVEHRPLVLSPDIIWLTILQGVAQHVHLHAERLRSVLVAHEGKKKLEVAVDIDPDSPETDWSLAVDALTVLLEREVTWISPLKSDFSTSGPIEKLVSQITLLDVFESYYDYVVLAGCGFPEITLTGTTDDWLSLRNKIDLLEPFQLDFWLPHLRGILDEMYNASQNIVHLDFWRDMYKKQEIYGAELCSGWLLKFVPYFRDFRRGTYTVLNPMLDPECEREFRGATSEVLPPGLSVVPFRCVDRNDKPRPMEIIGGFTGVEQDDTTFALQPKIGWAVRNEGSAEWDWLEQTHCNRTRPTSATEFDRLVTELQAQLPHFLSIPNSFFSFYKRCNGMEVESKSVDWWIMPMHKLTVHNTTEIVDEIKVISRREIRIATSSHGDFAVLSYDRGNEILRVLDKNENVIDEVPGLKAFIEKIVEII